MLKAARPRIALIDDDPVFVGLMRDLLEGFEGYDVLVLQPTDRAEELVKRQRPDLVLLDVHIGGGPAGWAILERLTRDPATRSVPVIVCSVVLRDADEPLLRGYGVDVLPKPFDLDVLLDKVTLALARS